MRPPLPLRGDLRLLHKGGGCEAEERPPFDVSVAWTVKLAIDDQTTGLVASRLKEALGSSKLVVCLGSRLELASFCNVEAICAHVVGGATTTAEAKELLNETFADFLITDDVPEAGSGVALAKEFRHLKTLVLTQERTVNW